MSSIATIMGLTSYNPYKEAITMLVGGASPYLIDHLTLEPTSVVSKIDRIRETLFGIRTRFLKLTQKNALTKYTWFLLKSVPYSLATSKVFSLPMYLMIKSEKEMVITENTLILINCVKHLVFWLFLSASVYDELNPLPPKNPLIEGSPPRDSSYPVYYYNRPATLNYSGGAWKDSRRVSEANLGQRSPLTPSSPGGYKFF